MTRRDVVHFTAVLTVLAVMDGLVFYWPHNQGFFSLTYGADRFVVLGQSMDAWHLLKRLLILLLYTWAVKVEIKRFKWWVGLGIVVVMSYLIQTLLFNWVIKTLT